jgi:hypothetical protein
MVLEIIPVESFFEALKYVFPTMKIKELPKPKVAKKKQVKESKTKKEKRSIIGREVINRKRFK